MHTIPFKTALMVIANGHLDSPTRPALAKISITTAAPLPPKIELATLFATMTPSPGLVMWPRDAPLNERNPDTSNRVPVATNYIQTSIFIFTFINGQIL